MNQAVQLPRPLVNKILTQAQADAEQEICGLIGARDDQASNIYPVDNIAATPDSVFEMAPDQQISAMKAMRERGETLLAIYHSHPHTAAQPSPKDIAEANYEEAIQLIISLNTVGVLEMKAYRYTQGSVTELSLFVN